MIKNQAHVKNTCAGISAGVTALFRVGAPRCFPVGPPVSPVRFSGAGFGGRCRLVPPRVTGGDSSPPSLTSSPRRDGVGEGGSGWGSGWVREWVGACARARVRACVRGELMGE